MEGGESMQQEGQKQLENEKMLLWILFAVSCYILACAVVAVMLYDNFDVGNIRQGFVRILTSPSKLTTDYFALGGLAAGLLNVAVVGLICCFLFWASKAKLNSTSVMAFFLTIGFSAFGMNALNVWPFILGAWLYAWRQKEPFGSYVNAALFSAALSPFVSEALFANYGLHFPVSVVLALVGGCFMGFVAAVIIPHMVPLHKGFNQFNAGLSNGFMAFVVNGVVFSGLKVTRLETGILGTGYNIFCVTALFLMFALCVEASRLLDRGGAFQKFKDLFSNHGHKRDYVSDHGVPAVLMNMGIHGAFVTLYYVAVGGAFTGPTFGCVLCMLSLVANCASPKTVYPIMIGYVLFSLLPMSSSVNTQSVLVGFCFATSLAPIVGIYGVIPGVIAGILHCAVVGNVSIIHGGFNLYNGGFTSGLVCLVLVPILENFFKTKEERSKLRALKMQQS
jgi:hypothetical protein